VTTISLLTAADQPNIESATSQKTYLGMFGDRGRQLRRAVSDVRIPVPQFGQMGAVMHEHGAENLKVQTG
jgi:hypothetical protein